MMNTTFAVSSLQTHFKKTFENSEKEVELAILHVEQSVPKSDKTDVEIRDLRKKVSESFCTLKKMVMQFNSASLYFIGLNIDPLNTRLTEFLNSDDFGLRKQRKRKWRLEEKEAAEKAMQRDQKKRKAGETSNVEKELFETGQAVSHEKEGAEKFGQERKIKAKDAAVRKPLFETEQATSTTKSKTSGKAPPKVKPQRSDVDSGQAKKGGEKKIAPVIQEKSVRGSDSTKTKKIPKSRPAAHEKYTDEEMRAFTAEMSASSEEDGPQHGGTLPAPTQGSTVTMLHIEKGKKLELEDGEIE